MIRKLMIALYVIIGIVIANSHQYFVALNSIKPIISAVLAILLWPLVLLAVNLHIS